MDPFYFLDIESKVKDDNDDIIELNEFECYMYPNGSWGISTEGNEGTFSFSGNNYKRIKFNNDNKQLFCYAELTGSECHIYNINFIKQS